MGDGLSSLVILICALSSPHGCTAETARSAYHGEPEGRLTCEARMAGFRAMLTESELSSTVVECEPVTEHKA